MPTPYTVKRLTDVKDSAAQFGVGEKEVRFAKDDLDAERTGVSHHRIKPTKRQPFGHQHERGGGDLRRPAGSGPLKLDDDVVDLEPLDAVRVAPGVTRAFEAGPGGIEVLAIGARHDGDGEIVPGWWSD